MSILTELKKLTKKKNATIVSQALPDSLDGDGSGSSGGGGSGTLVIKNLAADPDFVIPDEVQEALDTANSELEESDPQYMAIMYTDQTYDDIYKALQDGKFVTSVASNPDGVTQAMVLELTLPGDELTVMLSDFNDTTQFMILPSRRLLRITRDEGGKEIDPGSDIIN